MIDYPLQNGLVQYFHLKERIGYAPANAQHHLHSRRRHGIRRYGMQQLRLQNSHAAPRPPRRPRNALYRCPCLLQRLLAQPLRPAHGSLLLAHSAQKQRPMALGSALNRSRPSHRSQAAAPAGLPHRLHRQVAPRLGMGAPRLGMGDQGRQTSLRRRAHRPPQPRAAPSPRAQYRLQPAHRRRSPSLRL